MSSSDGWWARKLNNPAPAAPPQQYQQQPSYPATGPAYTGPAPLPPGQNVQVTKDNVVELAGRWQGGQGTRTETGRCPNCGSGDYFSRANAGGAKIVNVNSGVMASAAPHCFDCGHNGLYSQAGGGG